MTSEADFGLQHARSRALVVPLESHRAKAFRAASTHSRNVRILRVLLPVSAVFIFGYYFLTSNISITFGDMEASVEKIEVNGDSLRMVNPKMAGATDDNGTYEVTADYAEQDITNPSTMRLHTINAKTTDAEKGWSHLTAPTGTFYTKAEKLDLFGGIKVTSSDGMVADIETAKIDMKSKTVKSPDPVVVRHASGTVRGKGLAIQMAEGEIVFERDVRARVEGRADAAKPAGKTRSGAGGLSGLAIDSGKPIDITSNRLTILNKKNVAHFAGDIKVTQGTYQMTSARLDVHYARSDAAEGKKPSSDIRLIEARDDVRIKTEDGRRAKGAWLKYDKATETVRIGGGVTLSRDETTLTGREVVTNLKTQQTDFPPGERVHGHFVPESDDAGKSKKSGWQSVSIGASQLDLSRSRGQPIDVDADTLHVDDARKVALFKGDVRTAQGGMKMRSRELRVEYTAGTGDRDAANGAAGRGSEVTHVRAKHGVLITTEQDQAVTSEWAVFDMKSQTVTIGGNVVLSQGENVVKGDLLVIDLKTGQSRIENKGDAKTGKRVRGLFMPKQVKKKSDGSSPAKTPSATRRPASPQ